MTIRINPSILAADFANLQSELETISIADFVHVDVMDNHFVPNLTFGQQMVARFQEVSEIPLDVHLMIDNVDTAALDFAKLGVASITFHLEASSQPIELATQLRSLGCRAGIAIKPASGIDFVLENLKHFDQVLVMTVEPGFGGQKFMAEVIWKVSELRNKIKEIGANVWLQVDGGIDENTIGIAAIAGADTFVAGSSIFRSPNRAQEIQKLRNLAIAAQNAAP